MVTLSHQPGAFMLLGDLGRSVKSPSEVQSPVSDWTKEMNEVI